MDLLVPTITGILIAMILCPPIRFLLFPDTPTAPVDPDSDGTQPATGDPGLHDSITGAPERHKGEAAEQEASDLVNIVADVAIESASGKYGQAVTEDAPEEPSDPEATVNTTGAIATAADLPPGNGLTEPKTKKPMKKKVSKVLNQVMRVVSDVTDIYERFSKSVAFFNR